MDSIRIIEDSFKKEVPSFRVGDAVRVNVKIIEGDKERLQTFEGIVISRRGSGTRETFTLRKISYGVGVERIFPLYSPMIEGLEVIKQGDVRRAKLYYLRGNKGKTAKVKEKSLTTTA